MKNILTLIGFTFICAVNAQDSTQTPHHKQVHSNADDHAPIGVMGDHMHGKGEWMASYRFMTMSMNGNLLKSDEISDMEIYQNYMVAPQVMTMDMHMLGLMYAPSDNVTLLLMGNFVVNSMDLKMMSGMEFTGESSGISDTKFGALIKVIKTSKHRLHGNLSVSIPTGSVHVTGSSPMAEHSHLAYPMQTGSGTLDPTVGITYLGRGKRLSVGSQTLFTSRVMRNHHDYNFGQKLETTAWLAGYVTQALSFSGRLKFMFNSKIEGADANFNPMMMPLFNSDNSGVRILNGLIGANYLVTKGALRNFRVALEGGYPLLQNVHGVQMKRAWSGVVGIQYAFGAPHEHL